MKLLKVYLLLMIVAFASQSHADSSETGQVVRIIVEGTTTISVFVSGIADTSDCSGGDRWTLNINDGLAKQKYDTLLAAFESQSQVTLKGLKSWGCGPFNSNKIYYVDAAP